MRFARCRPVKVVMLGAGGTGGHIAPHLYRLLYAMDRPVRIILCDGDVTEEKNLVRQNFCPADLGENKAKVLAERYSSVFGMETEYVPEYIEDSDRLKMLLEPEMFTMEYGWHMERMPELVILLGCVDNNKSRKLCNEVFYQSKHLVYIDAGNGEHTGQVVCGVRAGGRTMYPPVGAVYPDILEDTDKFPTELSCAEASVSAPQSIMANVMAATAVLGIVYNIITEGETTIRQASFSTKKMIIKPELQKRRKSAA